MLNNDLFKLQQFDFAQLLLVLKCSSLNTNCVIKTIIPYFMDKMDSLKSMNFFISLLYIYYINFEDMYIYKPYSSDSISGEFFVICKNYLGLK